MPIYNLLQIMLVLCTIKAQVSAVAAAAAASLAMPGCKDRCGDISIPYPFGIGSNCSASYSFWLICNTNFKPPKPFFIYYKNKFEVLEISLEKGTIRVQNPVIASNCKSRSDNRGLTMDLSGSPFSFSDTYSRFTAMGCDNLALINQQKTAIGGCMSFCNKTSNDRSCFGINCCQTRIPPSLKFINASLRSIDPKNDDSSCRYAFMVDQKWFSNLSNPFEVENMEYVPVVLDWKTNGGDCKSFEDADASSTSNNTHNASLCAPNAICRWRRGLCYCRGGYDGNPYLPNGCQDIDECASQNNYCDKNSLCVNTQGHYRCEYTRDNRKMAMIGTGSSLAGLVLIIGTWLLCKIIKKRKKAKLKKKFFKRNVALLLEQQLSSGEEGYVDKTKIFTSKELEKATDQYNKNRILGQGGQGTVYKGMLADGRIVAIKKSKIEDEGKLKQFINEISILSQINHINVVKLHGCCLETEVPMLVYEFIPNGTLSEYIHDENSEFPLSWDMRLRIAIEVAGALSYLHSATSVPIYHRDIKSTNILLDEKFRAKVADFGTSRSIAIDHTHVTTKVQGTFGYLDPVYLQSSQFTDKSDVYSFGVVLVELLTGEKAFSSTRSEEGRSLAVHFISAIEKNDLSNILDDSVAREGEKEEIRKVANLANQCLNLSEKKRPTMREVTMALKGIRKSNEAPIQEHYEDKVEEVVELPRPRDTGSTSTGSFANNNVSASLDVQPLLFN